MGLTQAQPLIYGDPGKADEFAGLFSRRNSLSLPADQGGGPDENVINAGGTGNELTSIYMVAVGPDLFHLIYPKGSGSVGVRRKDLGQVTDVDVNGKKHEAVPGAFWERSRRFARLRSKFPAPGRVAARASESGEMSRGAGRPVKRPPGVDG